MRKTETAEFNELSLKVFGKPYEWQKLTKKGLVVGTDKALPYVYRRVKLTPAQAKMYMIKTLEMREAMVKEIEAKKMSEAKKNDSEKIRLDLIPPEALNAVGRAFTFGAKKYSADNWRGGFEWRRLIGASIRHINAFNGGEDLDPESGLCHIDHALACLAMLSAHIQSDLGKDDRYKRG